jgi:hypothetical protein
VARPPPTEESAECDTDLATPSLQTPPDAAQDSSLQRRPSSPQPFIVTPSSTLKGTPRTVFDQVAEEFGLESKMVKLLFERLCGLLGSAA